MTARFSRSGCSRVRRSGWYVSTSAIRSSRAMRATNVANARVAASAAWRSSSDEHDRPLRGDAAEPAQQRLQGPRLAPLGVGEVARRRPRHVLGALGHARQAQQDRAGVAGEQRVDLVGRSLGEQRPERLEHGRPRRVDRSVGLPAQDERRLAASPATRSRASSTKRVTPIPAPPRHDDGRGRARRGGGDRVGDPRELRLPADEPSADHASRHSGIVGSPAPAPPSAAARTAAPRGAIAARYPARVNERRAPHPANDLNELPGEEWLYFTKSVWTTAYPSELGHARRKAHGANKPPRLMARLIEFFTRTGELVLDPFAGVGGTLFGAAIARGPAARDRHRAGSALGGRVRGDVAALPAERDGDGAPRSPTSGPPIPGGARGFDPSGLELRLGDARALLAAHARGARSTSWPPIRRTTSSCR